MGGGTGRFQLCDHESILQESAFHLLVHSLFPSFIHSFNKHLVIAGNMPGTVKIGDTGMTGWKVEPLFPGCSHAKGENNE